MTAAPRILILTAAFGEGHNSAARNLAHALNAQGAVTSVKDPCMLAAPRLMSLVNSAYRLVTTRFPRFWKIVYESTARHDFNRRGSPVMRKVDAVLVSLVAEFKPDAVISTYPLYPHFKRIHAALISMESVTTVKAGTFFGKASRICGRKYGYSG